MIYSYAYGIKEISRNFKSAVSSWKNSLADNLPALNSDETPVADTFRNSKNHVHTSVFISLGLTLRLLFCCQAVKCLTFELCKLVSSVSVSGYAGFNAPGYRSGNILNNNIAKIYKDHTIN